MALLLTRAVPRGRAITGEDWRALVIDLARLADQTVVARACLPVAGGSATLSAATHHAAVTAVPCTLTLPAAALLPDGRELTVKDESGACGAASAITVQGAGAETVDGAAGFQLKYAYAAARLITRNGLWWRLDNNDL